MPDLRVEEVRMRLGEAEVLQGVSFSLERGEVIALLGPSGSGKTTLLRVIAGLERPDQGRIQLGEDVLADARRSIDVPAERRNLGLVFQSYALWPHRTVFENVAYGLRLRKTPAAELGQRVNAALGRLGLEGLEQRHPHQLSGGQQQRVAIARALVYDPRLLLLDEPLSNLDAKLREEARSWLRALIRRLGIGAICVTHDQVEALAIADRILLLDRGRIVQEGPPARIYEEPATLFAAQFMGSTNQIQGTIAEVRGEEARLEGPGFSLWGLLRSSRTAGEAAIGIVRVEKVGIAPGPDGEAVGAEVDSVLYLGERWEVVFRLGASRLRAWARAAPPTGAAFLLVPRRALWIF